MTITFKGKPPQLLTPDQVAEICQVPLATVYAWSSRKTGPRFVRVGRHLRVRPADLNAWLEAQAKDDGPDAA